MADLLWRLTMGWAEIFLGIITALLSHYTSMATWITPDWPGSLGKFLQQNKLYNYHNFCRNTLRMIFSQSGANFSSWRGGR